MHKYACTRLVVVLFVLHGKGWNLGGGKLEVETCFSVNTAMKLFERYQFSIKVFKIIANM